MVNIKVYVGSLDSDLPSAVEESLFLINNLDLYICSLFFIQMIF